MPRKDCAQAPRLEKTDLGLSSDSTADAAAKAVEAPLPRSPRKRRRAKEDRGLPPDSELERLAADYLTHQRRLWPELVEQGLLPEPSPDELRQMVDDIKARHRAGAVSVPGALLRLRAAKALGGFYGRYSCDNSSPTSITDQLVRALAKAKAENRFVPWIYVYCDYSVTGLDASRVGYTSYKKVLANPNHHLIDTTYVDDFTRASRDELEWWRLGSLTKKLRKRLIGASDGFDLSSAHGEMMMTLYGLLNRQFMKSLREKVVRGMRGAAGRGTTLGKPSFGFTRKHHRDGNGNIVRRPDGRARTEGCIDPATSEYRLLMFELFVDKCWSVYRIARHFNKLQVDGWDGWHERTIRDLLWSPSAVGVFIWNQTRREWDCETGKFVVSKNPRREWEVKYDRTRAIVPMDLWRAARRKLAAIRRASPVTGRKPSRNQHWATTLFSGTLFCEQCESELKLIRSTERYKQLGCLNGIHGAHGCTLKSSKSTRVIEECLLTYLRDALFNESTLNDLVVKANQFLSEEARKPRTSTAPLKAKISDRTSRIKKLIRLIEREPDDELCRPHNDRIKELQREIISLTRELHEAEARNAAPPPPLELNRVHQYVEDLRATLTQETPAAAEAIRALTGKIMISQEPIPGRKRGARWIARFTPDLLRLLGRVADKKDYPDSKTLGFLMRRNWTISQPAEVRVEKTPEYVRLAPIFAELRANGTSACAIAAAHGMPHSQVETILKFADTGVRPGSTNPKPKGGTTSQRPGGRKRKYVAIAREVVSLHDVQLLTFSEIARRLGAHPSTVARAYDYAQPEHAKIAIQRGGRICRPKVRSGLQEAARRRIRKSIGQGVSAIAIAKEVGCGLSTIYRERRWMQAPEASGQ